MLITGGSGRLGRELTALMAHASAPPRADLDVTDAEAVLATFRRAAPAVVVHAAAFTDVAGAERDRAGAWRVNVLGTRNVATACAAIDAVLVHVSTDYVFWGDADDARRRRGGYVESDATGPVRNYYASTKLAAEDEARLTPRHLIVRTSFRAREWPHPVAFTDLHTTQTYVDEIAPEIAAVAEAAARIVAEGVHVLHVAGAPTTAFELARRRSPDVRAATKGDASVDLPDDVGLDSSLWHALRERLR
ncbi:NAD(P)-dependent oxidoreductase [soil metagenome]